MNGIKKLRIAIVTSGRFHVCDLARELSKLGHEVKFYSLVPPWRTKQFQLPPSSNRWMLPNLALAALGCKFASDSNIQSRIEALTTKLDRAIASRLEPCDVLIGMSGMCNEVARVAKRKYGAKVWIERGSRHILSQQQILAQIPGASQVSQTCVERELCDYDQADTIVVLSKHCEESFIEFGVEQQKLFRNPLGVNLQMFSPTVAPSSLDPTVIMTGTWSLQKGVDVLTAAWQRLPGVRLLHVGPVGDFPLPTQSGFQHFDKVDQPRLREFYSQSHVFALASRQEGLATVLPQALACGLTLVCTTRSGGEDLKMFTDDPEIISVVEPDDVDGLTLALSKSVEQAVLETGTRQKLSPEACHELSWAGCGKRYNAALVSRV